MKNALAFAIFLALPALSSAQTIRFVRADADPNTGDGLSWATAFPDLNQALAIALHGDEIWLAAGAYKPTTGADRYASFTLPNGVRLYGGFAGTENALEQRDWTANPTILSGDIGVPGDAGDNSYGILYAAQCDTTTTVDGLIFEHGNANNPDDVNVYSHERTQSGGAIYLNGQGAGKFAYAKIENCVFRFNHSDYYGTVFANGRDDGRCAVQVLNCDFHHNHAGYAGGGLAIENHYGPQLPTIIAATTFSDNVAQVNGGGLFVAHHGDLRVQDCDFVHDSIYFDAGGAITLEGDGLQHPVVFERCNFLSNKIGINGASGTVLSIEVENSDLRMRFRDCVFGQNQAGEHSFWNATVLSSCHLQFEQCVFWANTAKGLFYAQTAAMDLDRYDFVNCLFLYNNGREFTGQAISAFQLVNCILLQNDNTPAILNSSSSGYLAHTLISHPDCAALGSSVNCGPGMRYGLDPQFADPANGDFHLLPCSPALDAGSDPAVDTLGIDTDIEGNPRIANAAVEMGPYEFDRFVIPASIQQVSCAGGADGAVSFGSNACQPFTFFWLNDAGQTGNYPGDLAPGVYHFTITDAIYFADTATVVVPGPEPLQVFVTIVPASGPTTADGAVLLDSIAGGTPPFFWPLGEPLAGLENLLPGTYTVTLTDAAACSAIFTFEVDFTSGVENVADDWAIRLAPNPVAAGATARLSFDPEKIATVTLYDGLGQVLRSWQNPTGPGLDLRAAPVPGVYFLHLRSATGEARILRWMNQ